MSPPLGGAVNLDGPAVVIKTHQDYQNYICKFKSHEGLLFPNGFVLQTWHTLNKNNARTSQNIHQILKDKGHDCTLTGINSALVRLTRDVQIFKKNISKNWDRIVGILNLPFRIPVPVIKKKAPIVVSVTNIENKETEMQLKRDCDKCPVLRKAHLKAVCDLKSKIKALKNDLRDMSKRFDVKRVNQNLKRNAATRDKLRQEKFTLRKENLKLQKKLNYLKSKSDVPPPRKTEKRNQTKTEYSFVKDKILGLKSIIKDKEERIKELDLEVCCLRNSLKELEKKFTTTTIVTTLGDSEMEHKRKQYSVPIRKCIYMCLFNQVAIEKAGPIIAFVVKELCHRTVSSIPGPSTASLMAYEMGVLSDLQLGEHLFNAQDGTATISWDATTKESCHVNECHIAVDGQQLTMKLSSLSSGKTESYVGQITTSIQNLATTFALYKNIQQQIVMHKFKNCFASTLTDRAAVNHCVNQELSAFLSTELVELNCNVHPIEGIASQARRILKKLDTEFKVNSGLFGSEGRAANLLYSISKLRYKMKSGDPGGFRAFLNLKNLASGVITRYVGNRMHVLFHLAGTVYHLRDILKEFLSKYKGDAKMSVAILKDLENPHIIIQLRILGRLYAMQQGMLIDKTSPEARQFLVALMDFLEKSKGQLKDEQAVHNEICGQAHVENYALKLFLYADTEDRAGNFGKNVIKAFLTSSLLMDVLTTFGELSEDIEKNRKYAKWKALYINKCLQNGETPMAGPLPEEGDEDIESPGIGFENVTGPNVPPGHMTFSTDSGLYPAPGAYAPPSTPQDPPRNDYQPPSAASIQPNPVKVPQPTPRGLYAQGAVTGSDWTPPLNPAGLKLSPEQFQKGIKYCKFASSAMQYEDANTAIENLTKALKLLTTGKE